jgi:hypothetical protein
MAGAFEAVLPFAVRSRVLSSCPFSSVPRSGRVKHVLQVVLDPGRTKRHTVHQRPRSRLKDSDVPCIRRVTGCFGGRRHGLRGKRSQFGCDFAVRMGLINMWPFQRGGQCEFCKRLSNREGFDTRYSATTRKPSSSFRYPRRSVRSSSF